MRQVFNAFFRRNKKTQHTVKRGLELTKQREGFFFFSFFFLLPAAKGGGPSETTGNLGAAAAGVKWNGIWWLQLKHDVESAPRGHTNLPPPSSQTVETEKWLSSSGRNFKGEKRVEDKEWWAVGRKESTFFNLIEFKVFSLCVRRKEWTLKGGKSCECQAMYWVYLSPWSVHLIFLSVCVRKRVAPMTLMIWSKLRFRQPLRLPCDSWTGNFMGTRCQGEWFCEFVPVLHFVVFGSCLGRNPGSH